VSGLGLRKNLRQIGRATEIVVGIQTTSDALSDNHETIMTYPWQSGKERPPEAAGKL